MALDRLTRRITGQFGRPHGAIAPLVAGLLNQVNGPVNRAVVRALEVRPGQSVLDVGFGGGVGIRRVLKATYAGRVVGADVSGELVDRARRAFSEEIAAGRVEVVEAGAEKLPFVEGTFDVAYSVNSIHFWPDPLAGVREIRRVLAPGGRLVVGFPSAMATLLRTFGGASLGYRPFSADDVRGLVEEAGFSRVEVRRLPALRLVVGVTPGPGRAS